MVIQRFLDVFGTIIRAMNETIQITGKGLSRNNEAGAGSVDKDFNLVFFLIDEYLFGLSSH
jgi:hypothetical protein